MRRKNDWLVHTMRKEYSFRVDIEGIVEGKREEEGDDNLWII